MFVVVAAIFTSCGNKKENNEPEANNQQTKEVNTEKSDATANNSVAQKEGYTMTESGLQYKILRDATSPKPGPTSQVTVKYEGKLLDGTIFDSNYKRGETNTFGLNEVIPGWTEGVQLMSAGSMYEFIIPAGLAYGNRERPGIPANSTLIFKIELLSFK